MVSRKTIIDYFVLIYFPDHSRAVGEGYVPEQILVAEKVLGRDLTPDEDVRHINGDVKDNRPSNLEIVSSNAGYKVKSILDVPENDEQGAQRNSKIYMPCRFQKECWRDVRLPIIKKEHIYLPYICSYQSEGDIYKCSIFWKFMDKKMETSVVEGE